MANTRCKAGGKGCRHERKEITATDSPEKGTSDGATKRHPVTRTDESSGGRNKLLRFKRTAGRSEDREQVLRKRADRQEQSVSVYSELEWTGKRVSE